MTSEPNWGPDENLEVSSKGNPWPCAVIMLICCLTFLGVCFAGVYLLINWPQR